jgi:hypothetical protein
MTQGSDARANPAFAAFAQVLPLAGFSGAAIALVRSPGGPQFIRKAAMAPVTNAALRSQSARQAWLADVLRGAAEVPEVLDEGEADGLYYFDMTFIPSRDANAYLASASFGEVEDFAMSVETLMRGLSERALPSAPPPTLDPLRAKIAEIDARTDGRFADLLSPIDAAIDGLDRFAENAGATVNHGDLTFENILVSAKRRLWLIDPIASPIDHYWMDWAKLFQDCEGLWHLHRGKRLSVGVTRWLRNRWLDSATALSPDYRARHYILLALTFARILPYARTSVDIEFVRERVRVFGQAAGRPTRGDTM